MTGAIIGSAVIGAGASYMGGKAQAKATSAASQTTAAAQTYATNIQKKQFEQTRQDQEPWRIAGEKALRVIQDTPDFEFTAENFEQFKDPAFDFRMEEGINALDRSAASRGRLFSGAQAKAVTRYGSNLASEEYTNAFNRALTTRNVNLAKEQSLAGIGQSATNVVSQAGERTAANIGNIATQGAQQQANSAVSGGNALANAYGNVAQSANQGIGNYLLFQRSQQPATSSAYTQYPGGATW